MGSWSHRPSSHHVNQTHTAASQVVAEGLDLALAVFEGMSHIQRPEVSHPWTIAHFGKLTAMSFMLSGIGLSDRYRQVMKYGSLFTLLMRV
jgi:hypothetical protein